MGRCNQSKGTRMTQDEAYKAWWHNEGSGIIPLPNEDMEEFAHRITQIAWSNGAFMEREQILFAIKEVRGRSQEPVAWMFQHEETGRTVCIDAQQLGWGFEKGNPRLKKIAPLYTTPPQRKPLTDEQIEEIAEGYLVDYRIPAGCAWNFARDIEATHGIKE